MKRVILIDIKGVKLDTFKTSPFGVNPALIEFILYIYKISFNIFYTLNFTGFIITYFTHILNDILIEHVILIQIYHHHLSLFLLLTTCEDDVRHFPPQQHEDFQECPCKQF